MAYARAVATAGKSRQVKEVEGLAAIYDQQLRAGDKARAPRVR